tara:strand:+ start:629 stop:820 length:192 start_codon:yes stop_codon:yes gene_type:complete
MITIKHNLSGETKEVTKLEHFMMMDSDDWKVIEKVEPKPKPKPKPKEKPKPKAKKKAAKKKKK